MLGDVIIILIERSKDKCIFVIESKAEECEMISIRYYNILLKAVELVAYIIVA